MNDIDSAILAALENGPARSGAVAHAIGVDHRRVSRALCELRKREHVTRSDITDEDGRPAWLYQLRKKTAPLRVATAQLTEAPLVTHFERAFAVQSQPQDRWEALVLALPEQAQNPVWLWLQAFGRGVRASRGGQRERDPRHWWRG